MVEKKRKSEEERGGEGGDVGESQGEEQGARGGAKLSPTDKLAKIILNRTTKIRFLCKQASL